MATLPTPGENCGTWGEDLNEWLLVCHNPDGTIKEDCCHCEDGGGAGGVQGYFTAEGSKVFAAATSTQELIIENPDGFYTNDPASFELDANGRVNILQAGGYHVVAYLKPSGTYLETNAIIQIRTVKGIDAGAHSDYGVADETPMSAILDKNLHPGAGGYDPALQFPNFFNLEDDYAWNGTRPVVWPFVIHAEMNWVLSLDHNMRYSIVGWRCAGASTGSAGGIQFDTFPQDGDFLYVNATGGGTQIKGDSLTVDVGPSGITLDSSDGGGVKLRELGDGGMIISSEGGGIIIEDNAGGGVTIAGSDIVIESDYGRIDFGQSDAVGPNGIVIAPTSGQTLRIQNLPTTAPSGANVVWNNGGTLKIT